MTDLNTLATYSLRKLLVYYTDAYLDCLECEGDDIDDSVETVLFEQILKIRKVLQERRGS